MASMVEIKPCLIRPTQDRINEKGVVLYARKLALGSPILPIPIVYHPSTHEPRAIDGHHRLAAFSLTQKQAHAWIVESPRDIIPAYSFPDIPEEEVKRTNYEIRSRFDTAQFYEPQDRAGNAIRDISQLIGNSGISRDILERFHLKF